MQHLSQPRTSPNPQTFFFACHTRWLRWGGAGLALALVVGWMCIAALMLCSSLLSHGRGEEDEFGIYFPCWPFSFLFLSFFFPSLSSKLSTSDNQVFVSVVVVFFLFSIIHFFLLFRSRSPLIFTSPSLDDSLTTSFYPPPPQGTTAALFLLFSCPMQQLPVNCLFVSLYSLV